MTDTFVRLLPTELERLTRALRGNVYDGDAILTSSKDTSFAGVSQDVPDEEVILAIKSVPCHY